MTKELKLYFWKPGESTDRIYVSTALPVLNKSYGRLESPKEEDGGAISICEEGLKEFGISPTQLRYNKDVKPIVCVTLNLVKMEFAEMEVKITMKPFKPARPARGRRSKKKEG